MKEEEDKTASESSTFDLNQMCSVLPQALESNSLTPGSSPEECGMADTRIANENTCHKLQRTATFVSNLFYEKTNARIIRFGSARKNTRFYFHFFFSVHFLFLLRQRRHIGVFVINCGNVNDWNQYVHLCWTKIVYITLYTEHRINTTRHFFSIRISLETRVCVAS